MHLGTPGRCQSPKSQRNMSVIRRKPETCPSCTEEWDALLLQRCYKGRTVFLKSSKKIQLSIQTAHTEHASAVKTLPWCGCPGRTPENPHTRGKGGVGWRVEGTLGAQPVALSWMLRTLGRSGQQGLGLQV